MASSSSLLCCILGLIVVTILEMARGVNAVFPATPWSMDHATFYDDDFMEEMDAHVFCRIVQAELVDMETCSAQALSSVLFKDGFACGSCYQIRCTAAFACCGDYPIITVTATNLCPPKWAQPSDNGGWCTPTAPQSPLRHIVDWHAGIVPITYPR
ncbi:hypothetical protein MUK42_02161 [Musa troglodytarum]|uniref:Expansin n=1 Tax=Musa troglodytarum TaxID=320322 RepID=A0A9E7ERG3_9LILI|nr:hypothetical protein MUK42_02161 [Musa troglodytarum]